MTMKPNRMPIKSAYAYHISSSLLLLLFLGLLCCSLPAVTNAFQSSSSPSSSLRLVDTIVRKRQPAASDDIIPIKTRFRPSFLLSSTTVASTEFYVTERLSRENAEQLMDETILPSIEYDKRIQYGGDAQEFSSQIVTADDPRTAFTYGEFEMKSMDQLIDLALEKHGASASSSSGELDKKNEINLIDLGSGCGRLVLYSALTRGFEKDEEEPTTSWTIHGIEISSVLHNEAVRASQVGVDNNCFQAVGGNDDNDRINSDEKKRNRFCLHLGPANDFPSLFAQTDIIFAYSTVWDNEGFSPELGAIVMSKEWNQLLSTNCRPGTIAITTDRVLDPNYGWKLVDRLDVDNREVFGSTGYIHILEEGP